MLERCEAEPGDLSLIYALATLTYHFSDHVAKHSGRKPEDAVIRLIEHFDDFKVIQAVANATKHVEYERTRTNPHKRTRARDVRTGLFPLTLPHRFVDGPYVDLPDGS